MAVIDNSQWILHFSKLFYDPVASLNSQININAIESSPWPPVTPEEVKQLILSLKSGRAAGPDRIPTEWLKAEIDLWSTILANLFTAVTASGSFPSIWLKSTVVPIYKKGDPTQPDNYRPISLLSIVGKIYAKYLLNRLSLWIDQHNIIGPEQIGFRQGKSILDHGLILQHLAYKYSVKLKTKLYVAFLDLKSAFDSINRNMLWQKLLDLGIDLKLLNLIKGLYSGTSCHVRTSPAGDITADFPTNRGVKQGCILAPTLFNLFINDLAQHLAKVDCHPPKLGMQHVPLLLYADDAVILARTRIGLKRAINKCLEYIALNNLQLNFDKSKIMVFSRSWRPRLWHFNNHRIEQVKSFKYLGLHFSYNLSWVKHRNSVRAAALSSSQAIIRFFYNKGGSFIPAALRVFRSKSIAQILFGIPLWISAFNQSIEAIQASFLKKVLGLPNCVAYSVMCVETGQRRLDTLAWIRVMKYWLKIYYSVDPNCLIAHLIADPFFSDLPWQRKLIQIGLSPELLGALPFAEAFRTVKGKLLAIHDQNLLLEANKVCSPLSLQIEVSAGIVPLYLHLVECAQSRRAMTLARCNVIPSAVLWGRYEGLPPQDRICPCSLGEVESLEHLIFICPRHAEGRSKFLDPIIRCFKSTDLAELQKSLFEMKDGFLLNQFASFLDLIVITNMNRQTK